MYAHSSLSIWPERLRLSVNKLVKTFVPKKIDRSSKRMLNTVNDEFLLNSNVFFSLKLQL